MSERRDTQSLTSKIIKILRVTNEPLSAHAISELYSLTYKNVKEILKELEKDNLVQCLKTTRGTFYFLPEKYLTREKNLLDSDETLPFIWYEDFTEKELVARKNKIVSKLEKLKKAFSKKKVSASDYFREIQQKNEELSIITQIIEDRKTRMHKACFYCNATLDTDSIYCSNCKKKMPKCSVCKRAIFASEQVAMCPNCQAKAHEIHILEWLKTIGNCPNCKHNLLENQLVMEKEEE
ncbi:MAG: hypothetical protein FK733_15865 [Asgard group archaeon]|nr:hypothetical protein [Asgard group archaeon]